jgi:glutathione S-transferase
MTASILYGSRESGHCYKVKLALVLAELHHEYREVDLDVPFEERREDFRAVSRFGEVPVFVDGSVALAQSNAILMYIAERSGKLGGELPREQLAEWLFWEANRVGFSVPNLRAARSYAAGRTNPDVTDWLEKRAFQDLDRLDTELSARPFLINSTITIADIACCAYLYWPEQAGLELARWPNVVKWLERISTLPGWAEPYDLLDGAPR